MNRENGILTIYCMNTRDYLKFYGEDKYWNHEVKEDFLSQTRSMWTKKVNSKYDGRIFNINHGTRDESVILSVRHLYNSKAILVNES